MIYSFKVIFAEVMNLGQTYASELLRVIEQDYKRYYVA